MSLRVFVLAACCAAVLGSASTAGAATLKGTVTGAPYSATSAVVAVPSIFLERTARKAGLKAFVGVVLLRRTGAIKVPGKEGSVKPFGLRLGDRFTLTATLARSVRRSPYPRVTVKTGKLKVTKRSKVLSTDELAARIALLTKQYAALSASLARLDASTTQGFAALTTRVNGLSADLDAVKRDLAATKLQLSALAAQLAAATATLQQHIDDLRDDLQPQLDGLLTSLSALTTLLGGSSCGTAPPTSVMGRICALEALPGLGGLATTVTNLDNRVTQISTALTKVVDTLTNQSLTGDLPAALTPTVTSVLGQLYGLIGTTGSLGSQVNTIVTTTLPGIASDLTTVTNLVGGLSVPALKTTVDGIVGQISALVTSDSTTAGQISTLQSQTTALTGYLTGSVSSIGGQDPLGTLTTSIGTLNTTAASLSGKVSTICGSWRTALDNALAGQSRDVKDILLNIIGTVTLPNLALPTCP